MLKLGDGLLFIYSLYSVGIWKGIEERESLDPNLSFSTSLRLSKLLRSITLLLQSPCRQTFRSPLFFSKALGKTLFRLLILNDHYLWKKNQDSQDVSAHHSLAPEFLSIINVFNQIHKIAWLNDLTLSALEALCLIILRKTYSTSICLVSNNLIVPIIADKVFSPRIFLSNSMFCLISSSVYKIFRIRILLLLTSEESLSATQWYASMLSCYQHPDVQALPQS